MTTFRSDPPPTDHNLSALADQLGEWASNKPLKGDEVDLIVKTIDALRSAEARLSKTSLSAGSTPFQERRER